MKESDLKCIQIYAADVKSRPHFQDKDNSGEIRVEPACRLSDPTINEAVARCQCNTMLLGCHELLTFLLAATCRLLITFANSLDPGQDRQTVDP